MSLEIPPDEKGNVRYPRVARGIRMRDGTGRRVEGNQHPDPRAEAVRWAICEAELIQAIGRGRGVNRTADNPLQIDILTNVCLPIEVDEIDDLGRDPAEPRRGHARPRRGADQLPRHGGGVPRPVRQRRGGPETRCRRENPAQTPIEEFLIDVCAGFLSVAYRRTGSRGPARRLLYDPRRIDPAAWLSRAARRGHDPGRGPGAGRGRGRVRRRR